MRLRLPVSIGILTWLLTACSGGGGNGAGATLSPVTVPPVTPSASASASPSPTSSATSLPPEARAATTQGVEAFGRLFVTEVREAFLTRDPARVERLSEAGCLTCSRYIASINEIRGTNAQIGSGYSVTVLDAAAPGVEPGASTANVTIILKLGPFVVTDSSGKVLVNEPPRDRLAQNLRLVRSSGQWKVAEVTNS